MDEKTVLVVPRSAVGEHGDGGFHVHFGTGLGLGHDEFDVRHFGVGFADASGQWTFPAPPLVRGDKPRGHDALRAGPRATAGADLRP